MGYFYDLRKGLSEIRTLTGVTQCAAEFPVYDSQIHPNTMAPIVFNNAQKERELGLMRWGLPGPILRSGPLTHIANIDEPYWQCWRGIESRCLVPATSFCEWVNIRTQTVQISFALSEKCPLFAFAGLWTHLIGTRGSKYFPPVPGGYKVFGLLMTEANAIVARINSKAMPVVLRTREEMDVWMKAPWMEALAIRKPLPDNALQLNAG